jgi:hypothetical protein
MIGGAGPYTYKVTAGAIPAGMSRNGLTLNGPFPAMNLGSGVPVDVVVKGPLFLPYTLTVQVTDGFGVSRSVKANWYVFNPIDFVQPVSGGAPYAGCYSGPAPGTCQSTDLQYTLGSPYDNVAVKVTKVCYYDSQQVLQCPTDAAGIAAALPPGWYATAKSGTVTVGMDCGTACSNWYGDVYIVLVDKANCVSPGNVISGSEADVNIDI